MQSKRTYWPIQNLLIGLDKNTRNYLILLFTLFVISAIVYPITPVAMWMAFCLAAYSAMANDSIQTIGTFIASNYERKWYYLWLYIGGIFVVTFTISWVFYNGDVSYDRLNAPGLETAPTQFSFLQLAAPIVLLILTRFKMPVSTSILLLSAFSTKISSMQLIISKSLFGYGLAFGSAVIIWYIVTGIYEKYVHQKAHPIWLYLQWISSGFLWSVWIMQDAANVAVVLPRSLSWNEFLFATLFMFAALGMLFYLKGDKIQSVVNEKAEVQDVRAATVIDFVYAIILYYLQVISNIPISTTWVFIGLLGGREIGITLRKLKGEAMQAQLRHAFRLIRKDIVLAGIGLLVSVILALSINEGMRKEVFGSLF